LKTSSCQRKGNVHGVYGGLVGRRGRTGHHDSLLYGKGFRKGQLLSAGSDTLCEDGAPSAGSPSMAPDTRPIIFAYSWPRKASVDHGEGGQPDEAKNSKNIADSKKKNKENRRVCVCSGSVDRLCYTTAFHLPTSCVCMAMAG
jgi:hypothetical protein